MSEYNITWDFFTLEEQAALKKAISLGARNYLTHCVLEMTPQKEVELQKLANQMEPIAIESESDVMKKYTIDRLKKGQTPFPESPEEEAALQKLLDEEQLERQKKFTDKTQEQEDNLKISIKPLDKPLDNPLETSQEVTGTETTEEKPKKTTWKRV